MPFRKFPLIDNEIYHVFNRGIADQPVFFTKPDYLRSMRLIDFYRFKNTQIRFSYFNRLNFKQKSDFMYILYSNKQLVKILAFCLMPNHVHFLLKQLEPGGISKFMRLYQDSYAKYLNTRASRHGSVWQAMFKAVRIETENQLLHVFRYITLNPLTSFIVKDFKNLASYPYVSYKDYISQKPLNNFVNTELILAYFKESDKLRSFIENQVNYQRTLNQIKHLIVE